MAARLKMNNYIIVFITVNILLGLGSMALILLMWLGGSDRTTHMIFLSGLFMVLAVATALLWLESTSRDAVGLSKQG